MNIFTSYVCSLIRIAIVKAPTDNIRALPTCNMSPFFFSLNSDLSCYCNTFLIQIMFLNDSWRLCLDDYYTIAHAIEFIPFQV